MLPTYTGIGSRDTPSDILNLMESLGGWLAQQGYTLRSGGARGADTAFEQGCLRGRGKKEIFLPFPGFNQNQSPLVSPSLGAFGLASNYHPHWENLSPVAKKLMARNSHQILGEDLKSPSQFVVCWTPDGCETSIDRTHKTGGTGQAIDIASDQGIPIFNLFHLKHILKIRTLLNQTLPDPAGPSAGLRR